MKPKTKNWKRVYGEDDVVVRIRGTGSTKPVFPEDLKKDDDKPRR